MEDWLLAGLRQYVGRSDRESLGPRIEEALTPQSMGDHHSYRVANNLPSLTRGLVVVEQGVIPDYARVRRVFHLTNAITKYYYSPFFLEEQAPGYHARVAWLDDKAIAFTRDGRYCAFTSDRAADFVPPAFFEENPRLVVALAIEGTGIPYAKPSDAGDAEDVVTWATEIFEMGVREPLATADKYELLDRYEIKRPLSVGPFEATDVAEIRAWMKDFESGGGRGIVLKPSERHHRPLKYSLPSALLRPAPAWLGLDSDIQEDPYFERLAQAACSAVELELAVDAWDFEAVGRALLAPLATATGNVDGGAELVTEFSVWVHQEASAEELLVQLEARGSGTSVEKKSLDAEGDGFRLIFERRFDDATSGLQRRLSGASYRD